MKIENIKKPLVSIGLPTSNRAKLLKQTLTALLGQTYVTVEIIISNNESSDDTDKLIKKMMKTDKRIKYFYQKKRISAIENFNFVLSKAKGQYFMWASDDDVWDKNFINEIMSEYGKSSSDVALIAPKFDVIYSSGGINKRKRKSFSNYTKQYITFEDFIKEDFYGFKTCILYGIYRIKLLRDIGGYANLSSLSASDYLTLHKLMSLYKVKLLNKKLFYKRERFYKDKFEKKQISKPKLVLDFAFVVFGIAKKTFINFLPGNFYYLYKNSKIYYDYNNTLIRKYYAKKRYYYTYLNMISSVNLFLTLLPNDIRLLKNRNKSFFGKL